MGTRLARLVALRAIRLYSVTTSRELMSLSSLCHCFTQRAPKAPAMATARSKDNQSAIHSSSLEYTYAPAATAVEAEAEWLLSSLTPRGRSARSALCSHKARLQR